jgi:hypothetical protein
MELHVGSPVVRGGLTVFPVFAGGAQAVAGYTLGGVEVAERAGTPVVDQLVVTNWGTRPSLLLEGELLEGGWQHRVVARSVLIGAGSTEIVAVRCVEQGRWAGEAAHVRGGERAPVTVRAAGDQHEVWRRVARFGPSATGSLLEATRDRRRAAEDLVRGLRPVPFQSGVLVGVGGQPLFLEVFDVPATLVHVWDGLLAAAALDAVGAPAVETPGYRARKFVRAARFSSLTWGDRTVHAVAVNRRHKAVAA